MTKLTESKIEQLAIELLQNHGYTWKWGPDIAPDGQAAERAAWDEVLLLHRLDDAVKRINPKVTDEALSDAIKQVKRINNPVLLTNNEIFHKVLTEGIKVSYRKDGEQRGEQVWLIDFKNITNNDFLVVNQFTVIENHNIKRPDLILFVNGIQIGRASCRERV